MSGDLRVPMAVINDAFGLAITVIRPSPNDTPATTSGVWFPFPLDESQPFGTDLQRIDPRRLMGVTRTCDVPNLPRGSTILAAEQDGEPIKPWRVDGYDRAVEHDLMRVILLPAKDWMP